jgi:DNA-binding GntR family transcriptional regulator
MVGTALQPERRSETQATAVYTRLQVDVISAALSPGQKLRVRELCDRYGVGLNPVREALNRATRNGLVRHTDLRGFFVAPVSMQDLRELTRARCLIAEVALRESIALGDHAWEEAVLLARHRLARLPRQAPDSVDALVFDPAWEAAHRAFHRALIAACGSSWLIESDQQLFDAADRYRHLARRSALSGTEARPDQHEAIMKAVLDRDTPSAVALLQAHYQRTSEHGLKALGEMTTRGEADADHR